MRHEVLHCSGTICVNDVTLQKPLQSGIIAPQHVPRYLKARASVICPQQPLHCTFHLPHSQKLRSSPSTRHVVAAIATDMKLLMVTVKTDTYKTQVTHIVQNRLSSTSPRSPYTLYKKSDRNSLLSRFSKICI